MAEPLAPSAPIVAPLRSPTCAEAINRYCPRSGNPIVADSLARYRGLVVGFCNPRCRDDFAAHVAQRPLDTRYFDALICERELPASDPEN
jgi:hypothetical protein